MVMDVQRLSRLSRSLEVDLVETFSSIQGEGPLAGQWHFFVRFSHCDIHCRYCDTPLCHGPRPEARLEGHPGSRDFQLEANPMSHKRLAELVREVLGSRRHQGVAITGGEPLLQPWGVRAVAGAARERGVPVLLETDGNLPEVFLELKNLVDVLSLDWKLPSATGEPDRFKEHSRFLELAGEMFCYVKAVFTEETPPEEVLEAARLIARLRPQTTLVLQPATPCGKVTRSPSPGQIRRLQELALQHLREVRVLPQIHKLLDQP